jgi:hypothetical protein
MTTSAQTTTEQSANVIPSRDRVEVGSVNIPVGSFPGSASSIPSNPGAIATRLVSQFNESLSKRQFSDTARLFLPGGYWRDHLALSWDLHTLKGREQIQTFLDGESRLTNVEIDSSTPFRAAHFGPIDGFGDVNGIEFFIKLETEIGRGRGVKSSLSLRPCKSLRATKSQLTIDERKVSSMGVKLTERIG